MRYFWLLAAVSCVFGQTSPFTLEQVMGASFPSSLAASPSGGKVAWVSNVRGVRNIMVATAPEYVGRAITTNTAEDGMDLDELQWTPDGTAVVYTRNQGSNGRGEYPNPTLDAKGAEQDIWMVGLDGAAPRRISDGDSPKISSKGQILFSKHGQLWWAPVDGKTPPAQVFHARGTCGRAVWSPDGQHIAFESGRGDHGFIGVFDVATSQLRYLDPSTDRDSQAEWSPDGKWVAFIRQASTGLRTVREAHRTGEPWSIRVVDAAKGEGREVWRAKEGPGSVFRAVAADRQLWWGADGRLVFPWEAGGWLRLYSIVAMSDGRGGAALLTPGEFEVEHAAMTPGGREMIYSSNQGDIDRRHLWRVAVTGGGAKALTPDTGIEVYPTPVSDTDIAFLRSDGRNPLRAMVLAGGKVKLLDATAVPDEFPLKSLVEPQQVVFTSADGMPIHGQLFLPNPAPSKPARAVVFFHGGPQRQMLLGWHYMYYYWNSYALNQYLASRGFVVLSVNYRSGVGYGMDFREALGYGPSGGSEYNDVQGAGMYLRSRTDVDGAHIGVWGGSYGGYLVALALARASAMFQAGSDFHGVHDWARELGIPVTETDYKLAFEASPMASVAGWKSPVLLIQGDDDRNVQFNQTVMLTDALRRQHVPYELMVFPDEVHDFLLYRSWLKSYEATVRFLEAHLK